MRRKVLFAALGAALLILACDGIYRVVVPFCPVSDSAKAKADSIPFGCPGTLPDTAR